MAKVEGAYGGDILFAASGADAGDDHIGSDLCAEAGDLRVYHEDAFQSDDHI